MVVVSRRYIILILCLAVTVNLIVFRRTLYELEVRYGSRCPDWRSMDGEAFLGFDEDSQHDVDGLNVYRQRMLGVYQTGLCQGRHIILPRLRRQVMVDEYIPWEELYESAPLDTYTQRTFGLRTIPSHCLPSWLPRERMAFHCSPALTGTLMMCPGPIEKFPCAVNSSWARGPGLYGLVSHMHLAPPLQRHAERIHRRLTDRDGRYACLHLRTEADFSQYFNATYPAYVGVEETARKVERTMRAGHDLFGIRVLYVAGDHGDRLTTLQAYFGGLFDRVLTKECAGVEAMGALASIQLAALDQEVCRRADIFIGNSHSGWSEITYFLRTFPRVANGTRYGDGLGRANLQINTPVGEGLREFCPANGVHYQFPCPYEFE